MRDMTEKYVIVGPEDHDSLLTFWNTNEGWVEFENATRYDARILTAPLPREAQYIIDAETLMMLTPITGWGV